MSRRIQPDADAAADTVIETARGCAIAGPNIRRLAAALGDLPDAAAVIDRALDAGDPDAAVALMLAAAVREKPPTVEQVGRVIPVMDRIEAMPVLVGCAVGDRVGVLLDLLEGRKLSAQRDALALYLAVVLLGDRPMPPELLVHLRRIGRVTYEPEARVLIGLAASGIDDPGVRQALSDCIDAAEGTHAEARSGELHRMLEGPVSAVLPEAAAPKVVTGFTVRRAVPRVGRNEPCPCGSGRKYKHCCWRKDEARRLDPSPVAGLTMAEYRARAGEFMSPEEFGRLRPQEMLAQELDSLPTPHLIRMQGKLQAFRYWDEAERVIDTLVAREDLTGDPDGWREDLIHEALFEGQPEVALRQVAALREPANLGSCAKLMLSFIDPSADRAGIVEQAAEQMLRGDDLVGLDLAFALLRSYPALGILVARAIVDPSHPLDSETILEDVEDARDRLQLPPGDPAREWYEVRSERHYDDLYEEELQRETSAEKEKLLEEVTELRRRASEATARSASLERALRDATRRAEELDRKAAQAAQPQPRETGDGSPDDPDAAALRREIADLKALIGEGNEERTRLRQQLSHLGERVREAREDAHRSATEAASDEADDGLELDLDAAPRTRPLVPAFSADAEESLRSALDRVARVALRLAGRLAAGEQGAWSGVKALRLTDRLLSARVGAEHRLLFEIDADAGRLVVSDLIPRRDLEKAIARHAGTVRPR